MQEILFSNSVPGSSGLGNFTIGSSSSNTIYFTDRNNLSNPNIGETGTANSGVSETIQSNLMATGALGGGADLTVLTATSFSGVLTISGNISTVATGSGNVSSIAISTGLVQGGSAQPTNKIVISGVISDGGTGLAKVSVFHQNSGVLDLAGPNTFSGGYDQGNSNDTVASVTQIGVDSVGSVGAITSSAFGTGTITIKGGDISSDSATARTVYNNLVIPNYQEVVYFGDTTNNGLLTFDGNGLFSNNSSSYVNISTLSNVVMSGVLSASSTIGLIKSGTATLTLSGSNTYGGATTVENGTLVAGANALSNTNGAFGKATSTINLGDATSLSGNLSPTLLIGGAFTVSRNIAVGSANTSTMGIYTLGGSNATGTATYSGAAITLNQAVTLQGPPPAVQLTSVTRGPRTTARSRSEREAIPASSSWTRPWRRQAGVTVNFGNLNTISTLGSTSTLTNLTIANAATVTQTSAGTLTGDLADNSSGSSTMAGTIAGASSTVILNNASGSLNLAGTGKHLRWNGDSGGGHGEFLRRKRECDSSSITG